MQCRLYRTIALMTLAATTILGVGGASAQEATDCLLDMGFQDVSLYEQTQNYAQPELSVTCDGENVTISGNNLTTFEFVMISPADLAEFDYTVTIPQEPQFAEETTQIPILGLTALAANGNKIFGPNEAPNMDYGDPYLDGILDYCNGHTARGEYHFHARPDCLFSADEATTPGTVVGYALDGFPILVPYLCVDEACNEVVQLESSWQRTQDIRNAWEAHEYVAGAGDLDECNGMMNPTGLDVEYAYFATDTFPYFNACYVGVVDESVTRGGGQGGPPNGDQGGQGGPPDGEGRGGQGGPPGGGNGGGRGGQGGQGGPPPPNNGG